MITSKCSHHQLYFYSFQGQCQCTSTWFKLQERNGKCIHQNEAWLLQVAVASRPDHLLRGHQGGSGRQQLPVNLPQNQDSQALIQGPRGRHLQQGRRCRGRCRRCRRSGPPGRDASAGAAGAGIGGEAPAAPAPAPNPVGKAGARGAKRKTTQADHDAD